MLQIIDLAESASVLNLKAETSADVYGGFTIQQVAVVATGGFSFQTTGGDWTIIVDSGSGNTIFRENQSGLQIVTDFNGSILSIT